MDFTYLIPKDAKPSRLGIIGATKGYGYTLLAQLPKVPLLSLRVICSRHADECCEVLRELGYPENKFRVCSTSEEIGAASDDDILIVDDFRKVPECGITSLVECTGNTAVSMEVALKALRSGINVYMVSKETDSICGPLLNHVATENGTVYSLVNGDQPRNLVDLYSWAKFIGLEIVAAGKASEYDFVFDPDTCEFSYPGFSGVIPELREHWHYQDRGTVCRRAEILKDHLDVISADLCEMNLVSNITGLAPAAPTMNYPVARISELAEIFVPEEDGGILKRTGVVDVFYCFRAPDEASFGGGEFVIVRCENDKVWKILAEKGHVVSRSGKYACLYEPYHYMGVETPASILLGDQLGLGTHPECRQVSVLGGTAKRDIPAGSVLKVEGHHHVIESLRPELVKLGSAPENIAPFYLLNGAKVVRDIPKGGYVTLGAVKLSSKETLGYYLEGLKL